VVETATRAVGWLEETHGLPRQSLPDYLTCQICMDLLLDPVITPCGITYDRACLQRHLEARGSSGCDPVSGKPLSMSSVVPNLALREVLDRFLEERPWAYQCMEC